MPEAAWLIVAALLSLGGMAWLALAMDAHWGQVMHRPAAHATGSRARLRRLGIAALPLSLLACLVADRPSMAVLVWVLLLAGSALVVALALAWRPRLLALAWPAGPTGGEPGPATSRGGHAGGHPELRQDRPLQSTGQPAESGELRRRDRRGHRRRARAGGVPTMPDS